MAIHSETKFLAQSFRLGYFLGIHAASAEAYILLESWATG